MGIYKQQQPNKQLKSVLSHYLAKRVIDILMQPAIAERTLQSISKRELTEVADRIQAWRLKPNGTEGYRTAEVTLGGVDCDEISSKTMEVKNSPGLYFIGEVLDVSGWLGGFNFQWAWSSGWVAGQVV
jgi:predicted Rossmann fold flavoprotein